MATATRQIQAGNQANLLVNPGFEINQRNNSYSTSGVITLDQWKLTLATSTATISQLASTIGTGGNSLQFAYAHGGGGSATVLQKFEVYAPYQGQTVTFAATLKSGTTGTVKLRIADGVGTTDSAYNVGTGSQRIAVSRAISASATKLEVGFVMDVSTATAEINDATLCLGFVPLDFTPVHPSDDLRRCLRYYEILGGRVAATTSVYFGSYCNGGSVTYTGRFQFMALKGGTPTVTKVGTWTLSNTTGQPTISDINPDSFTLTGTSTGAGFCSFYANGTGMYITAEWNP